MNALGKFNVHGTKNHNMYVHLHLSRHAQWVQAVDLLPKDGRQIGRAGRRCLEQQISSVAKYPLAATGQNYLNFVFYKQYFWQFCSSILH